MPGGVSPLPISFNRSHETDIWTAIWVSFGTIMQGFDNVCNAVIIGMAPFQQAYGVPDASSPSGYLLPARYLGAWQGATQAGSLIGAFAAGYMMETRLGRKNTIIIACAISSIGVGVQYGSTEWTVYFAGKFVNGK
jgi:MFS family permease